VRSVASNGRSSWIRTWPTRQCDRHRWWPGHHGSRQPNRIAFEAGAPSIGFNIALPRNSYRTLTSPAAQLSIPLLCHAQDASRHARQCTGDLSRRLWHAGRAVRASHPTPDAEGAAGSDRPLRRVLLAQGFNFETLAEEGIISPEDLQLFEFAESAEERWARWLAADCGPIPPWSMQKGRIDVRQCSDLRHLPMLAIPNAMLTLPQ
jgi:hypothetical protein